MTPIHSGARCPCAIAFLGFGCAAAKATFDPLSVPKAEGARQDRRKAESPVRVPVERRRFVTFGDGDVRFDSDLLKYLKVLAITSAVDRIGLLAGKIKRHGRGGEHFVVEKFEEAIPVERTRSAGCKVMSPSVIAEVQARFQSRFPDLVTLGWWRAAPATEAQISVLDREQQTMFAGAGIGLIVSGLRSGEQFAVVRGRDSRRLRPFHG